MEKNHCKPMVQYHLITHAVPKCVSLATYFTKALKVYEVVVSMCCKKKIMGNSETMLLQLQEVGENASLHYILVGSFIGV